MPASDLLGVGRATAEKLARRGITTIGGIAKCDKSSMKAWLGINGIKLWEYANGLDASRVAPAGYKPIAESVGHGITCAADLHTPQEVKQLLLSLAPRVSRQLREIGLLATGIQLSVRDNDLYFYEYQTKLKYPTQSWKEMVDCAMALLAARHRWIKPIRAVTIRAINFISEKQPRQLDLFEDQVARQKEETLERTVDDIRRRFGDSAIMIASTAGTKLKRDQAREMLAMPVNMYI